MYISGANTVYVSSWTPYIDKGIYKVNEDLYLDITGKAYLHGVDINGNDFLTTHKDNPQNSESKDNLGPRTIKITNEIKKVIKRISVARETLDTNIVYNETNKTLSADYTLKAWDSITEGNVLYTESEYPITIPAGKAYNKGWDEGLASARASDISVSKRTVNNQEYYSETIDGVKHWLIPVTTSYKINGTKSGGAAYKSDAYVDNNTTLDFTSIYNKLGTEIEKITIDTITRGNSPGVYETGNMVISGSVSDNSNHVTGKTYTIWTDVKINDNITKNIEIDVTKIIEELQINHLSTDTNGDYNAQTGYLPLKSEYAISWGRGIILKFQDTGPKNKVNIASIITNSQSGNIDFTKLELNRTYDSNSGALIGPYTYNNNKYIDVEITYTYGNNQTATTVKNVVVNDWPNSSSDINWDSITLDRAYNQYDESIIGPYTYNNNKYIDVRIFYNDTLKTTKKVSVSDWPDNSGGGGTIQYADDGINYQYNDNNGYYWRRIWTDTDSVWIRSSRPMVVFQS